MNLNHAANLLTVSRIILTPLFAVVVAGSADSTIAAQAAKYIFLWVVISDVLDGNLARQSRVKNQAGCFLDALADRIFIGIGYLMIYKVYGVPPYWLFLIVAFRVVGMGVLWFIVFFASGLRFQNFIDVRNIINVPNPLGKTTVDLQLILMGIVLFGVLTFFTEPLIYLVAFFSVTSSLIYVFAVLKTASGYNPQAVGEDERQVLEGITACRNKLRRAILIKS